MNLIEVWISFSQLLNAVFGGHSNETLSSRSWRYQHKNKTWMQVRRLIDGAFLLFFRERNHCYEAYLWELRRKQRPVDPVIEKE